MLYYIINTLLAICITIGWIGIVAAISTTQHFYGLIGTIACFIGLGLLYLKDKLNYDQDDGGKLNE